MLHVGCHGGGFLRLHSRAGLGLLLRQLARMHHPNPIEGFWRVMKDAIGAGPCFAHLHLLYQCTRQVLLAHHGRPIYEFH
jgi:hypothetical protein